MRERIGPWVPAIFCAVVAIFVTIGNVWSVAVGGSANATDMVFMLNMPLCFCFVGVYLTKLRNDNRELRDRVDALEETNRPVDA